ncbi:MAG TPA: NAD(P)/FAD-dependent oxidoreductase [bacterium]|nr:NAD(P)/FAD-dependent oxidoreductase [bacterium]
MPRTPDFDLLMRALRMVRRAQGAPRPPTVPSVSRRDFLRLSAAAAAAVTIPGCLNGEGNGGASENRGVAIIGGGLAGLHCAHRLNQLGIGSRIFEARPRIGGRILTDRSFPGGQHAERGAEFFATGHHTMRDLAQELGIDLLDFNQDSPGLRDLTAFINGRTLSNAEIVDGLAPIALAVSRSLDTLQDQNDLFVYFDKPNGGEALDALSLAAWFDREGIAGSVRELLEVAYTVEFGLDPDICNCLNFLLRVADEPAADFDLYGGHDRRFRAADGNDRFTERLADGLQSGQVIYSSPLLRVREGEDGGYTLTFQRRRLTTALTASHVVLALPFSTLREIDFGVALPSAKRRAILELGYGQNTKLLAGFDNRPWRELGSDGTTISDLPYQSGWDASRRQAGEEGILAGYTGGTRAVLAGRGTSEAALEEFLDDIERVFPGARAESNGTAARQSWDGDPWVKGSRATYRVGQYTALAGAEFDRVGNLHFCGEHTSLDFQGTMEGAALTGGAVAEAIAEDLGVNTGAAVPAGPAQRIMARARAMRQYRRLALAR